jgi:hypothetical protein
LTTLVNTAHQLSTDPPAVPLYSVRLYPLSLERSALLAQFSVEEKHALEAVTLAYEEERERIEEEWRRGHERIRERLLEGIEDRRRRAREEKEGEGFINGKKTKKHFSLNYPLTFFLEAALDVQSRPHVTRKLRNKLNTSPPSTPLSTPAAVVNTNGGGGIIIPTLGLGTNTPIAFLPVHPHSLSIDELPSPFPLSLTHAGGGNAASGALSGSGPPGSKRRVKSAGGLQAGQGGVGGLGRSLLMLSGAKENEVEGDLGEIRRGNKRRRAVVSQSKHT